jgi:hypothetical protein
VAKGVERELAGRGEDDRRIEQDARVVRRLTRPDGAELERQLPVLAPRVKA